MELLAGLNILNTTFTLVGNLKRVLTSLVPLVLRLKGVTDTDKLVEEFFATERATGSKICLRGVLFPYSCSTPPIAYCGPVMGCAKETVKGRSFDLKTRRLLEKREVKMKPERLSPPGTIFNDVLFQDTTKARIAWLYPENFTGLIFDEQPAAAGATRTTHELFQVKPEQKPILCILPVNGQYDSCFGKVVEITGAVVAADRSVSDMLFKSLDNFRLAFLYNCIRPFDNYHVCLALDLRGCDASVRTISSAGKLDVVVGVQGLIEIENLKPDETQQVFIQAADSVPDRSGMGPLRAVSDSTASGITSLLSAGDIRWIFDANVCAIAAYKTVNFAEREEAFRATTELAHHWQGWQKHARQAIRKTLGREPIIRPVFVSDPKRISLFHPDGLKLPPRVEAELFSYDPSIRGTIDWLSVGIGEC